MAVPATAWAIAPVPPTADLHVETVDDPVPGQYVVLFDDSVSVGDVAPRAAGLASEVGGTLIRVYVSAIRGFALRTSATGAASLANDPAVKRIEQDGRVRAASVPVSWGLDRLDQRNLPLDGTYRHDSAGVGVHAYEIDSGIGTHVDDFGSRVAPGIDTTAAADPGCADHGTDVAGVLGGATSGVAPGVTLVPVAVLDCNGSGSVDELLTGIDWVAANARSPAVAVIGATASPSSAIDEAVRRATSMGVTFVAAAGNDATDACGSSPARVPEVLTVAATTVGDRRAPFSNVGRCVDLFAPGVEVPSVARPGTQASGTSIAAGYVAGAAARALEEQPDTPPGGVGSTLVENALPHAVVDPGDDTTDRLLSAAFLDDASGGSSTPTAPATPAVPAEPSTTT